MVVGEGTVRLGCAAVDPKTAGCKGPRHHAPGIRAGPPRSMRSIISALP